MVERPAAGAARRGRRSASFAAHTVSGRLCSRTRSRPPARRRPPPTRCPAGSRSAPRPVRAIATSSAISSSEIDGHVLQRRPARRVSTTPCPTGPAGASASWWRRSACDLAGHLADDERVRRDVAADHGRAEPPAGVDGHHRPVTGERAAGEHDAGAARADHPLDDDGHAQVGLRDAAAQPVGHRLDAVEAGPAAAHVLEHRVGAAHPQVGVLQAGEAGLGAVLAGRAGPDGDRQRRVAALVAQRRVGRRSPRRPPRPAAARTRPPRAAPRTRRPATAARSAGSSAATRAAIGRRPRSGARRASRKAAVVTAKPVGTRMPARSSSPRLAPLPPTAGTSPQRRRRRSAGRERRWS